MNLTNVEAVTVIVCTIIATVITVYAFTRRIQTQQRKAFKDSVQEIVDASITDVLKRQSDFERRITGHLNEQDRDIAKVWRRLGGSRSNPNNPSS